MFVDVNVHHDSNSVCKGISNYGHVRNNSIMVVMCVNKATVLENVLEMTVLDRFDILLWLLGTQ